MDNITTFGPFSTGDDMEISQRITKVSTIVDPYNFNTTDASLSDSNSSKWANSSVNGHLNYEPSMTSLWTYIGVRIVSGVLAILGNGLTLLAVAKFARLQTCTNYLICSLAVSDLLSGLMVPLVVVHEVYSNSALFIPLCLLQQTLALISSAGNGLSILYLSVDRFIYITYPLRYHDLVTPKRVLTIEAVTWIFGLISLPILVFRANHLQVGTPCRYHIFLDEWVPMYYLAPQALIFMAMTIGFHLSIAKIAYNQARKIQAQELPYNTLDIAINQSTKKISRTLAMVLGVYLCSIIPQFTMAGITLNDNNPLESYEKYTVAVYWANSWVNPLIYAWRLKDFKIAFKKIFTGKGSFIEVPGIPA